MSLEGRNQRGRGCRQHLLHARHQESPVDPLPHQAPRQTPTREALTAPQTGQRCSECACKRSVPQNLRTLLQTFARATSESSSGACGTSADSAPRRPPPPAASSRKSPHETTLLSFSSATEASTMVRNSPSTFLLSQGVERTASLFRIPTLATSSSAKPWDSTGRSSSRQRTVRRLRATRFTPQRRSCAPRTISAPFCRQRTPSSGRLLGLRPHPLSSRA